MLERTGLPRWSLAAFAEWPQPEEVNDATIASVLRAMAEIRMELAKPLLAAETPSALRHAFDTVLDGSAFDRLYQASASVVGQELFENIATGPSWHTLTLRVKQFGDDLAMRMAEGDHHVDAILRAMAKLYAEQEELVTQIIELVPVVSPREIAINFEMPSTLKRLALDIYRGQAAHVALSEALVRMPSLPSWKSKALIETYVAGTWAHLRILAVLPGDLVPGDVLPTTKRLNAHALDEEVRERSAWFADIATRAGKSAEDPHFPFGDPDAI